MLSNNNEVKANVFKTHRAHEAGVNFFDTAEIYGMGKAETVLGKCLKRANWPRKDYVLSTKILRCGGGVNDTFLSRKHIIEGLSASLGRLQVDYVDIVFAHRYDGDTPMEEICRAFNWLIEKGKAFYWATSEWTPFQIREAYECCEKHGLVKPVVDQCEYNLFQRKKVEADYVSLFQKEGYGSTVWSPLAGGYLTGKYNDGKEAPNTRYGGGGQFSKGNFSEHFVEEIEEAKNEYVQGDKEKFFKRLNGLGEIAKEIGCTQAQLSLAWVLANKDVSTAIVGSTKPEQMADNLGALDVVKKWTPELEKRIEALMGNAPDPAFNWRNWQALPNRRSVSVEYAKLS